MHEHVEAHHAGDVATEVQRSVKRAATGTPGNIDPERISLCHAANSVNEVLLAYYMLVDMYLPATVLGGKYSYE